MVSDRVAPAPYSVAQFVFMSSELTDDRHQWALEVLAGWSRAAKAVPYWSSHIQPIEWMLDLSYAFQKSLVPATASAPVRVKNRRQALLVQGTFDRVAVVLQRRFRARVNYAAATYRASIGREIKAKTTMRSWLMRATPSLMLRS